MQEITSDIITLSSDEEFEPPPSKKVKIVSESSTDTRNALKILDSLKEVSTVSLKANGGKQENDCVEENGLTIVIESTEKTEIKEEHKSFTSNSSVVIIDDLLDENVVKSDESVQNKSTNVVDDPFDKSEDPNDSAKANSTEDENIYLQETRYEEIQINERPSTSKASEAHRLLDQFLETCASSVKGSKYETKLMAKFLKMRQHFNNCEHLHQENSLKRMLEDNINKAKVSAPDAVLCFQKIFSYFLDTMCGASIEISEENLHKIKKLEKTCKLIIKKLKTLEESEVNFDEEADSTYLQIERYSKRLNEVYNKYCQLINKNPHAGRLLYERVHFVSSNYNEINRAITKTHKHNKFPTYYDIEKCVRKCVNKHNLPLTEDGIKEESKNCFVKLGNLLQQRRKKELYEDHCGFITLNEDPANTDPDLKIKLQNSLDEGAKKMKHVIEKYVKLQESNVNPDLSEDSEDSNYQSSNSDS